MEVILTGRRVGKQQQQQHEARGAELHAGRGGGQRVLDAIALSATAYTAKRRWHEAVAARHTTGRAIVWQHLSRRAPQCPFPGTCSRWRPVFSRRLTTFTQKHLATPGRHAQARRHSLHACKAVVWAAGRDTGVCSDAGFSK